MLKKFSAVLGALAVIAAFAATVPAMASASTAKSAYSFSTLNQEIKAGNRVEQAAVRRGYGRYNPTGLCDKQGRRFWCSVSGMRGDCFLEGQAWVSRYYSVRWTNLNAECY